MKTKTEQSRMQDLLPRLCDKEKVRLITLYQKRIRYSTHGPALRIHSKSPHNYRPIPQLDPALRARLVWALQRPDLNEATRAKIKAALK